MIQRTPGIFRAQQNTFALMNDLDSLKNVTDSSAIYEANTVPIFPLSEKVVNNIKQPEEMGHASTDVT